VVLVCGPTGSGKTTTLYSVLNTLNDEETSIMTVENPVEYQVQGLSQTEVNDKAGMTFPRALRAILRQDPDVLLIGEIRDEETAQIAMQAALTGHLVFSTLHTNDSLSAIPRLLDLGINPVILAESLAGIMSQRLLRTLCPHCRQPGDNVSDPAGMAFQAVTQVVPGARRTGCKQCNYSGYLGRTVVAEVVEINQAQRELLLGGESDIASFKQAMRGKFVSLFMAASRLIISGMTTAEEASRVLGQQFWYALADEYGSELPDLSAIANAGEGKADGNAILICGAESEATRSLQVGLESSWLKVHQATDPAGAEQALRKHENIDLVVVDLPAGLADEEIVALVADYRRHLAWSRLPALIRLPQQKAHWEILLREKGATSKFVKIGDPLDEVVNLIQAAVSDKADFNWGRHQSAQLAPTQ
jgi:energy-coupling factor transporter ATP-binding protein EcfA2/CheY-like chemotaxis protein